ncbi:hypothetical protein GALMADRAFT_217465 [Galerina marginata CBS 339.88]|uniref:Phosphatase 2A Regulatory Subunit A helical domain-containing protein n=1 Tax=Galerina marginata (strain CBS 339.88) TaxID=685588 RepID=A0A067SCZ8_GALM3|nr:hypothetical protein GALMADRAFT_217465 [Galerina marginata CBS 339.88]
MANIYKCQAFVETDKAGNIIKQVLRFCLYDRISKVSHGDIKSKSILITSWNWIYFTDFASYKPAYLPLDDAADLSFYFDMSGRRTCCLASERFYSNPEISAKKSRIAMDEVEGSAGCVIAELFLELLVHFEPVVQLLGTKALTWAPRARAISFSVTLAIHWRGYEIKERYIVLETDPDAKMNDFSPVELHIPKCKFGSANGGKTAATSQSSEVRTLDVFLALACHLTDEANWTAWFHASFNSSMTMQPSMEAREHERAKFEVSYDASIQELQSHIPERLSALLMEPSNFVKCAVLHDISSLCILLGTQKTNDVFVICILGKHRGYVEESVVAMVLVTLTSLRICSFSEDADMGADERDSEIPVSPNHIDTRRAQTYAARCPSLHLLVKIFLQATFGALCTHRRGIF